jgi:oxygen-independent coproporphyrinogen-3 oxidase
MYEWASEVFNPLVIVSTKYQIGPGRNTNVSIISNTARTAYLALGAGAHGYAGGFRYSNVLRIKTYVDRLTDCELENYRFPLTPATVNHHKQTSHDDMSEFMMTGLRLTQEGVSEAEFQARFGTSMRAVYGKEIEELSKFALLEWVNDSSLLKGEGPEVRLRLTQRGRLLGNQAFLRFVD